MPAPHKNTVYKPLPVSNPFQEGQDRAYGDILRDKMKEAQLWRKTAFINIGLFVISLILFFVSVNQQKTVPVLINVMPSGESQFLGEVRQSGAVQVPEASIHYEVRKFVHNLRSVSTDYQVVYANIDECFVMAASNYSPILRRFLLADSPFDLVGKLRRTVEIESVLNITGRSYQVNWTETVIESSSSPKSAKMRAVVTVRLVTPTDATIKRNPLGIYIENFEMTEL
jgi:type IV secretion system protein VirB5